MRYTTRISRVRIRVQGVPRMYDERDDDDSCCSIRHFLTFYMFLSRFRIIVVPYAP